MRLDLISTSQISFEEACLGRHTLTSQISKRFKLFVTPPDTLVSKRLSFLPTPSFLPFSQQSCDILSNNTCFSAATIGNVEFRRNPPLHIRFREKGKGCEPPHLQQPAVPDISPKPKLLTCCRTNKAPDTLSRHRVRYPVCSLEYTEQCRRAFRKAGALQPLIVSSHLWAPERDGHFITEKIALFTENEAAEVLGVFFGVVVTGFEPPLLLHSSNFTRFSMGPQGLFHRESRGRCVDRVYLSAAAPAPPSQDQQHDPTETPELVSTGLSQLFGFEAMPLHVSVACMDAAQALTRRESIEVAMAQ